MTAAKIAYLKVSTVTATTAQLQEALRVGIHRAPEGDLLGAFDEAKKALMQGHAPKLVERDEGAAGRWRIDDSKALTMIADLEKIMPPDQAVAQTAETFGGNESTIQRWRRKRREGKTK